MRSGKNFTAGTSKICREVIVEDGPTNVSFWWKLSTDRGHLIFYVDGKYKTDIKEIDQNYDKWKNYTCPLSTGTHKLEWSFSKTSAESESQFGWIDDLHIGPCEEFPEVVIHSPNDTATYYVGDRVGFNYTPIYDNELDYCTLMIGDEETDQKNESPINGTKYTLQYRFNDTGSYNWSIVCYNSTSKWKRWQSANRTISIMDPPPTVELSSPGPRQGYEGMNMSLTYTPSDNKLKNCTLYINGTVDDVNCTPENGTANTFSYHCDKSGNYTAHVECCDDSNNCVRSPQSWNITILKNQPPIVDLEYPEDNYTSHNKTVHFVYTQDDPDGEEFENCTLSIFINESSIKEMVNESPRKGVADASFNWTFDRPGNYSWTVICYDKEGAPNDPQLHHITIQKDEPLTVTARVVDGGEHYVNQTIQFEYTPTDDLGLKRCVLYLYADGLPYGNRSHESPENNITQTFNCSFPQNRTYSWSITCWDIGQNKNNSTGNVSITRPDNVCVYENGTSLCEAGAFDVDYENIGDAIRDLLPGGNITVMEGNYTEDLVIDKPLTLKGNDDVRPTIYGDVEPIIIKSGDVTISGFILDGRNVSHNICVYNDVNIINITNNSILNGKDEGIYLHGKTAHSVKNVNISYNNIQVFKISGVIGINLTNCTNVFICENTIGCNVTTSYGIARKNCQNVKWFDNKNDIFCSYKVRPTEIS
ncbi:hypothetical protein [Methanocrinis sp.]|uniref:hypothetical protein n=1 Tax=Methanocrinis sp. TaxID=3101522 RepID=UPI003D14928F